MNLSLYVEGDAESQALKEWLAADDDIRRHIRWQTPSQDPDKLGSASEVLQLVLDRADALTPTILAALIWLRSLRGTITVEVKNQKRSIKITSQRVRGLSADRINELAKEVSRSLDEE
ncbi:hypothetical protein FE391_20110 [Nonomuraea sp. KC401]|uniref:effector-associated constant component EACC1 n=1 Tax=unclassified Nonomuraea TaxID=2593643 RepID=UPI0010FCDCF8|nr:MULTISPECIES: hypothetical protein [unclassified Nonomuraea]NBE95208.1 hypothetical protein [Nonomuraea sp. K271]TLF71161.1 hypothetical protein FE391_20110 [Nonomuraea sp. KC401]